MVKRKRPTNAERDDLQWGPREKVHGFMGGPGFSKSLLKERTFLNITPGLNKEG